MATFATFSAWPSLLGCATAAVPAIAAATSEQQQQPVRTLQRPRSCEVLSELLLDTHNAKLVVATNNVQNPHFACIQTSINHNLVCLLLLPCLPYLPAQLHQLHLPAASPQLPCHPAMSNITCYSTAHQTQKQLPPHCLQ
jgi:hypothetical protein